MAAAGLVLGVVFLANSTWPVPWVAASLLATAVLGWLVARSPLPAAARMLLRQARRWAVVVAVVTGTTGTPERWAVVPFLAVLVAAPAGSAVVRRAAPVVTSSIFVAACLATGRASLPGTLTAAALVLGAGWYATRQADLLARAVDEVDTVREGLVATTALLESQSRLMSLDADRTIEGVTSALVDMGFEIANVGEIRDGMIHDLVTLGLGDVQMPPMPSHEGVAGLAITEDRLVAVEDYWSSPHARPGAPSVVRSAVAAPLRVDGHPVGVLLGASNTRMTWTAHDLRAVEALAAQASRALDNARRYRGQQALVSRLAELDVLKGDFLLGVSTDLRAPLTNVRGFAHTLSERVELLDEQARAQLLDRLLVNVDRLHDLIVGLLDFSRLSPSDDGDEDPGLDMAALVSEVVESTRGDGLPEVALTVAGDAVVAGDAELLLRAVQELVDNARRHPPTGARVEAHVVAHGGSVRVEVRDDGPGLPREVAAALHGDDGLGRLGAGLTLVVQTLAVHGSRLDARVDDGTRIGFVLPASRLPRRNAWMSA